MYIHYSSHWGSSDKQDKHCPHLNGAYSLSFLESGWRRERGTYSLTHSLEKNPVSSQITEGENKRQKPKKNQQKTKEPPAKTKNKIQW